MSLSGALSLAQSALHTTAAQTALISKNIANVSNPDYSRETATSITTSGGGSTTGPTQRAASSALLTALLSAQSASSSAQAISGGISQISSALGLDSASSTDGTAATDNSPATAIGTLSNALQAYANDPSEPSLATAAVAAAQGLASNLNQASSNVQQVRTQADSAMAASVATINSLLGQFQTVNTAIVTGTAAGQNVSDAQDTRDGILKQLSQQIGITTSTGADGGTSIYTDSGVTLFNITAAKVSFAATNTYTAATTGNPVTVNGVAITGSSAVMPIASGQLAGLATLRDTTTTAYQNQLDQVASGLISAFGDSGTSGTATTLPGLFTSSTTPGMPTNTTGLAATIAVNNAVNPNTGGTATLLRDGINAGAGSAYSYNASGNAGYSTYLNSLVSALNQTRSFDATSGASASGSLASYAASSVSWLEQQNQATSSAATYQSSVVNAATTALSNATGVNLDSEMSNMLEVEHAYQASAQLMNSVDAMYSALIQAFN